MFKLNIFLTIAQVESYSGQFSHQHNKTEPFTKHRSPGCYVICILLPAVYLNCLMYGFTCYHGWLETKAEIQMYLCLGLSWFQ